MDRPGVVSGRGGRLWRRHAPVAGAQSEGGRIPELDALRGLAVIVVVSAHVKTVLLPFAWPAVDLFFVLSGYLITTIILKNGNRAGFLVPFYIRRGLRIWPIYFLTVLAMVSLRSFLPRPCRMDALPYALTYTQNIQHYWFGSVREFSPYLLHTWSLAIEEQFYLIWPALVLLFGLRRVVQLALVVLATSLVARACGLHWWILAARSDGLALGGLLAALLASQNYTVRARRALTASLAAAAAVGGLTACAILVGLQRRGQLPYPAPSALILAVNVLWFGLVGLVVCHTGHAALNPLRRRSLRLLGQISYGLYLYHFTILLIADDIAQKLGSHGRPFWREALTVAACIVLAALSWRYVELPILALKERFPYRPKSLAGALSRLSAHATRPDPAVRRP